MKKNLFLILIVFLTACSSSSSQVTVTLPPPTFTATPPPTLTPTLIPASSTPEQPTEAALTPEIQTIVDGWKGNLSINEDGQFLNQDGVVIEGLVFNKESKMVEITRDDALGDDFTEQFDPKLIVVETGESGEIDETINYNFSLGENGQLERLKYPGTSEYSYAQNEVLQMIAENHSTAPGADLDTVAHIKEILSNFLVKPPTGSGWDIEFGDFRATQESDGTFFGSNKVKAWNNETQTKDIVNTSEFAIKGFGGKGGDSSYVVVAWMDANDNPIIKIVHGPSNLNTLENWLDFIQ